MNNMNPMAGFIQGSQLASQQANDGLGQQRQRDEQAMRAIQMIGSISLGAKGGNIDGPVDPAKFEQGLDFLQQNGVNVSNYRGRPEVADVAARASMTALQQIQGGTAAAQAVLQMQNTLAQIDQRRQGLAMDRERLEFERGRAQRQEAQAGVPSGYQRTATGLAPIPGGPADPAQQAAAAQATRRPDERTSDFDKAMAKADVDRLAEMQTQATQSQQLLGQIAQMEGLRAGATTGRVVGPAAAALGNSMVAGLIPGSREAAGLDAIAGGITLELAKAMKGALSDKDIAFLQRQTPNSSVSNEVATVMHNAFRAAGRRKEDMAAFYRTWAERNGSLSGADAAWNRFANENDLFVEDRSTVGGLRVNTGADWSKYVETIQRPARGQGAAPAATTPAPAQSPPAASAAAPAAAPRVIGPAPQGAPEGRTGRLPDGTRVRVTNGQLVVVE